MTKYKQELKRRHFLKALSGGVFLVGAGGVLAGCGGGSVLGRGGDNPSGGDGGVPGGGDPGTPVPTAQRLAAIDAINARAADVWTEDLADTNRKMLAYLQGRAEFSRVGLSDDGVVWGRFTDGAYYYFINNIVPERTQAATQTPSRGTRAANSDVPRSTNIQVLNGFGDYLSSPEVDVRALLLANGYTLSLNPAREATVEALRNVRGAGVFYLSTHGGDGDGGFALTTVTKVADAWENDPIVKQELKDNVLIYCSVQLENPWFGKPKFERVYGFTHRFIGKYWTFAPNSLVYIDACTSDELLIKQAAFDKGASLYAGWTAPTKVFAFNRAARFCFDRMLGANVVDPKEDPNQRPFDYEAVYGDLKSRGWDVSPGGDGYASASLIFSLNGRNPDYGLLAPSIRYMDVDEITNELILHGLFGQRKDTVRVGTTDLAIKSWTKEKIVCTLPVTGPGSAGPVAVIVAGHKSNIRNVTEWSGQFRYTLRSGGTLKQAFTVNARFRGDVGGFRDKPHEAPLYRRISTIASRNSTGTYAFTGRHSESDDGGTTVETWSGAGNLTNLAVVGGQPTAFYTIFVKWNPQDRKADVNFSAAVIQGNQFHFQRFSNGGLVEDVRAGQNAATWYTSLEDEPNLEGQDIPLTLDSRFGIAGGNWEKTIRWSNYHEFSDPNAYVRVEWDAITANYPPDPQAARSV